MMRFLESAALAVFGVSVSFASEYFVDSANGDDMNDGRSPETAWRSLQKVNEAVLLPGDILRFRRGGLWRGSLVPHSGSPGRPVTYTTYGVGSKPIIQNSIDKSRPEDWVQERPGFWSTRQGVPVCGEQVAGPSSDDTWGCSFQSGFKGSLTKQIENDSAFWRVACTAHGGRYSPHVIQVWGEALRALPEVSLLRFQVRASRPLDLSEVHVLNDRAPFARVHSAMMRSVRQIGPAWTPVEVLLMRAGPEMPGATPRLHLNLGCSLPVGGTLDVKFDGVWRATVERETVIQKDVGLLVLDHGARWGVKKWNNPQWEVPHDGPWSRSDRMLNDLDYYYDEERGRVVMKYPTNPGSAFGSVELALAESVVNEEGVHDVTYDGLWIRYGAAHGFGGGSVANVVIRNCDISWIGGGLHSWQWDPETGKVIFPMRFGNGIEFWGDCRNCLVERCRLWEIYDAAVTNQGFENRETDVTWRDNVIWNSEYSYEYWNAGVTCNVLFENNTCVDAGRGWGHGQRVNPNGTHLMYFRNRAATTNFVVRNNVFFRATDWIVRCESDWRSSLLHDNNLVYNDGGAPVMRWLDAGGLRLCDWREYGALGFDVHGSFAEPLFRDSAKRDYRLRDDSPGRFLGSDGQAVGARNMPGMDGDQSLLCR